MVQQFNMVQTGGYCCRYCKDGHTSWNFIPAHHACCACCAGVFQGPGLNCTMDPAAVPVSCVAAAVEAGLHRARFSRFHSMR